MYEFEFEGDSYTPPIPKLRASIVGRDITFYEQPTEAMQQAPPIKNHHFVFWLGLGMCLCLSLYLAWTMMVMPWIHSIELQWHYGDNQVSLFGADVSHGGVSRFIAFDGSQEIVIIEVVNNSYHVYTIPAVLSGGKLVTLSVMDVNGDGKPDLVVHVDGQEEGFALINNGKTFNWTK